MSQPAPAHTYRVVVADDHPVVRIGLLQWLGLPASRQTLEILQLGGRGILLKDVVAERLAAACRSVTAGRYWLGDQTVTDIVQAMADPGGLQLPDPNGTTLTPRQLQIVKAVVEGRSNKDIAEKLSISEETVKRHLTIIFDKTGMSSRLELAMYAVRHGIGS